MWGNPTASDVVSVKLACNGNVAVWVEAIDKFICLVAQVGLCREIGWGAFLPRSGLRCHVSIGRGDARRTRQRGELLPIFQPVIVNSPMFFLGC